MTVFVEVAAYAIVAICAIYGAYEMALRFLPCEITPDEYDEPHGDASTLDRSET